MVIQKKSLSLSDMEPLAREATRKALESYSPLSDDEKEKLTLGKSFNDTEGIFELYISAERQEDAQVISRATVNKSTGNVQVEVFLNK